MVLKYILKMIIDVTFVFLNYKFDTLIAIYGKQIIIISY